MVHKLSDTEYRYKLTVSSSQMHQALAYVGGILNDERPVRYYSSNEGLPYEKQWDWTYGDAARRIEIYINDIDLFTEFNLRFG